MRNLKKMLAVILAVCVMLTAMVPAFAEAEYANADNAKVLYDLDLYRGVSTTEFKPDLGSKLTREQAIVLLLRMFNLEDEANAMTDEEVDAALEGVTDASKIASFNKKMIAFAKQEGIVKGYVDGRVGVADKVLGRQYAAMILRQLGYDVEYNAELLGEFENVTGLDAADLDTVEIIRDDAAGFMFATLTAEYAEGGTVIEKYLEAKPEYMDVAVEAGLVEDATLTATVAATGAKLLKVSFNKAVDTTKAAFTVKKGSITVNVAKTTFADDKKSATLELASKITEGEYTVTVKGLDAELTAKVTAANEKVGKITFPTDKAPIVRGTNALKVTANYKIFNQYDEDITDSYNNIQVNPGRGTQSFNKGTITLTETSNDFNVDDKLVVSILDLGNNVFASQTFTVVAEAKVSEIAIEKLVNVSDDTKVITADDTDTNYALVLSLKDQYGNDVSENAYLATDISANISDETIAKLGAYDTKSVDGSDRVVRMLALPTAGKYKSGKAVVTMVSTSTGKLATYTIEVKDVSKVDTFTMEAPAYAAAAKNFDIPFTAIDQFGNEITKASTLKASGAFASFSVASSEGPSAVSYDFVQDYVKNKAILRVTNGMTAKGTITVTVLTSTFKQVILRIDVTDATVASVVSGTKDFTPNMVKAATSRLDFGDIIVKDQYAADFTLNAGNMGWFNGQYRLVVTTSDSGKVSLTGNNYDAANEVYVYEDPSDYVTLNGAGKGAATVTVKVQKAVEGDSPADGIQADEWKDVDNSSYSFTSKVVEIADITSYEVAAFNKVYNDGSAARGTDVTVNGILADGTKVVVDNTHYTVVPTNTAVLYNTSTGKLTSTLALGSDEDNKDIAVIITVNANDGAKIFTPNVTVSDVAPAVTTIEMKGSDNAPATHVDTNVVSVVYTALNDGDVDLQTLVKAAVVTKDQYGVELTGGSEPDFNIIVTNFAAHDSRTVNITNNGTTNAVTLSSNVEAGDVFNVTALSNGKTITFKVIVTE